jgi:general secretion pathway protein A
VLEELAKHHHVLLIVDDADRMSATQLLALTDLSRDINRKSLQLKTILVGQRRFRGVIRSPQLLSLADRVGADCDLGEMSPVDTRRYIYHRLRIAGGQLSTFTETAILRIHEASGGIPRRVNQYCGLGLLRGAEMGAEVINTRMMMDVIEEQRASMAMAS